MNYQTPLDQDSQATSGRSPWPLLIGVAALALALGGYWYFNHASAPAPQARRDVSAPVRVAQAKQQDMPVIEHTIGTVVANSTVQITARVQGQLQTAYFKEGQLVKKGQLLFQIDPRPYQAAYDNAEATLQNAQLTADRSAALLKQNAVAAQSNDNAQAAFLQAKANLEAARLNLEFTRITAPVNGKTGAILVQPGNLVTASASVGASALVNITEIQPIKVSFSLPQADLPRIQTRARSKGLTAQIQLHDNGGQDLSAPVDFINNAVAGTSGTIELRASVPNLDAALVPGQLVDVVVELSDLPDSIVVPREALNNGPNGPYVYVVTPQMVAEPQPVKILFDNGTLMAISGNVHDGDNVIIDGQLRVLPGGKVSVGRGAGAPVQARGGRRGGGRRGDGGGRRGGSQDD